MNHLMGTPLSFNVYQYYDEILTKNKADLTVLVSVGTC